MFGSYDEAIGMCNAINAARISWKDLTVQDSFHRHAHVPSSEFSDLAVLSHLVLYFHLKNSIKTREECRSC